MNELIWIAGVVALGAISAGPNNIIVMKSGMQRGILRTLPAIGGVVVGTLVQVAIVIAGFELVTVNAHVSFGIALLGSGYLAWLGANLIRQAIRGCDRNEDGAKSDLRAGLFRMSMLQFVNPKTWAMVTLAVAALQGWELRTFALVAIFTIVPSACLLLWALLGKSASTFLAREINQKWFDALMGFALIGLACGSIS